MALARVVYTQSVAGNKNFIVPFPYISRDHVNVTVNGAPASFTWLNTNIVQIDPAPAVGAVVEIRRVTERRNLLVDFKDGSTITETDLDLLALQNFYLAQEADDLAKESNGIANAAASIANNAIATANQASSNAASAVATANSAKDTANTALANANSAVSTANNALSIANTASSNASTAVATADAAQTAANSAVSTANSAKDTANSAMSKATTAVETANTAAQNASTALSKANTALANSETAISTANTALTKADAAETAAAAASQAARSAAASATTAVSTVQQLETQFNNVLESVQQIAGADLSDFTKNSDNLAYLTDKAAARANLGLGNVDNTSDLDKPVSLATQAALATKANVSHTHTKADITDLSLSWKDVTGKPLTFPPSPHTHTVGEVTGLGTAATANLTTSVIDTTPGSVLKFGDFGVGSGILITNSNLDNLKITGFYYASSCTNTPESRGSVFVSGTITEPVQLWVGTDSGKVFVRKHQTSVGWSPWQEIYHSGNLNTKIAAYAGALSFRNKIINGKMEISQRGAGFPNITDSYTLDRWLFSKSGAHTVTVSMSNYVPPNNEFQNSLRVYVTTASASIAANEYAHVIQRIEGINVRDLIGRTFTLSFWVRSSKTGVHCVSFRNGGAQGTDRSFIAEYVINAANTWEFKTITVNGGLITEGTKWDWTIGTGLDVGWTLAAGSNFHTTAGSWRNGNFIASPSQVNVMDAVGNTFAITGVQLEAGSAATLFEHRPHHLELMLCQRYYETGFAKFWGAAAGINHHVGYRLHFSVPKRVTPTITKTNASLWGTADTVPVAADIHGCDFVASSTITGGVGFSWYWTASAEL